ncbi:HlyD family secretion protein [Flectobacillus major]|uniref:HlyD family secretion protein n=1 Tax=Flectobacillus major TaxID=103 RepID=UPI00041573B7|nr:HlyD family efflux transporter periplasmic adaptor subunit [Flectobacillus major]
MTREKDIEIRSEEIIDFMSYTPTWLIKWGISVIFLIIIIFFVLASIIKYPETLTGQATITTLNPTVTIINKVSGRLEKISMKDEASVRIGDIIAAVESPANNSDVLTLKKSLNAIEFKSNELHCNLSQFQDSLNLGDFQNEYSQLVMDLKQYQELTLNPFYTEKIKSIESQLKNQSDLLSINYDVLKMAEKDIDNALKKNSIFKKLFEEKVIPPLEFQEKQDELSRKQQDFIILKKNIIQTNVAITDLKRQKIELINEFRTKTKLLEQSIFQKKSNLANAIMNWQKNYSIKAYSNGRLKFLQNLTDNQFVKAGEPLFLIVPEQSTYVGLITISSLNAGKLKIGQKVLISLDSYAANDFGKITGIVSKIFSATNQNSYTVQISLKNGLKSSLNKDIPFKPQMNGVANIITDNTSLTERLLKKIHLLYNDTAGI